MASYNSILNSHFAASDKYFQQQLTPELISTFVVPDQSVNDPVFFNPAGFIANEVGKMLKALEENDPVKQIFYKNKYAGLNTPPQYLDPNMSEDDMFDSTPSRYAQDPVDLMNQAAYMSNRFDNIEQPVNDAGDEVKSDSSESSENSE